MSKGSPLVGLEKIVKKCVKKFENIDLPGGPYGARVVEKASYKPLADVLLPC